MLNLQDNHMKNMRNSALCNPNHAVTVSRSSSLQIMSRIFHIAVVRPENATDVAETSALKIRTNMI